MKRNVRLVLLGGFLGSGKTTLMMRLAEDLSARGTRVGVITNDQGEYLVDTAFARSRGLATGEVLHGCFCCNFGRFVDSIRQIVEENGPDLLIAEPVGSCTDLVATVIRPLRKFYAETVTVSAYLVLADGERMNGEYAALDLEHPSGPKETLLSHQLRESKVIVLTKCDLIPLGQRKAAEERLRALNPGSRVIAYDGTGDLGYAEILGLVEAAEGEFAAPVELDYAKYAAAEAAYGWYNGRLTVRSPEPFAADLSALHILRLLRSRTPGPIAHAKVLYATERGTGKLSLVGGRIGTESGIREEVDRAEFHLNVRAEAEAEEIGRVVDETLREVFADAVVEDYRAGVLTPAPPEPTYRDTGRE